MRTWGIFSLGLVGALLPLAAQVRLDGVGTAVSLVNEDLAVLEARQERKDLNCKVEPADPILGFDLRFHSGYDVTIPLKELSGPGDELMMLFRVVPDAHSDSPFYFEQRIPVPEVPENAAGETKLGGVFDLGEGKYKVDWIMRDRVGRVCAHFWDSKAELSSREKDIQMEIPAQTAELARRDQFFPEPPVTRTGHGLPSVKLLVNFAPQSQDAAVMRPLDSVALTMLLRRVSRDPRIGSFSLVGFNIQEQREIYRQPRGEGIDFPALGQAVAALQPGTMNAKLLANKHGEAEFLSQFIRKELEGPDAPDALIFAGPKYTVDGSLDEELRPAGAASYPVFYLAYNTTPDKPTFRDGIARVVRLFGGKEYTVTRPRDLWSMVTEMVDRIVESKQVKLLTPALR